MFSERELRGRIDRQFRSNDDFRQLRGQLEIVSLDDRLQWESWKWPINEIAEDFAASYSDYSCSIFTVSLERRSNSNNPNFVGNIFQRWGRFFFREIYQNKKDILLITFSLHSSKLDVYSNKCMRFWQEPELGTGFTRHGSIQWLLTLVWFLPKTRGHQRYCHNLPTCEPLNKPTEWSWEKKPFGLFLPSCK